MNISLCEMLMKRSDIFFFYYYFNKSEEGSRDCTFLCIYIHMYKKNQLFPYTLDLLYFSKGI